MSAAVFQSNAMPDPMPSIDPPPGMVKQANPESGQMTQFALFSDSWIELQAFVGTAVEMPITKGEFEEKYGATEGSSTVMNCIDAMKKVQGASTEFGNPQTLRQALINDPGILAAPTAPSELYTHTVWLGQRVNDTSMKLASGYQSVLEELPGLPAREQVASLKAYLFDQTMGPIPMANMMTGDVGELIRKLGKFEQKMNQYNAQMREYTSNSSKMIADVNRQVGYLVQHIEELEQLRDDAYKAWRDFTIAAITTSVGCALIGGLLAPFTFGVSALVGGAAAIATGVGLGVKAAENRIKYNEYCDLVSKERVELMKKQRLRSDLGDFNTQMERVGPAMSKFLANLQTVEGVWVQMNTDMIVLGNSITESNVGDMAFLVKSKANLAIDSWKEIGKSARQFTGQSLIDYENIAFGQYMPEKQRAA